MRWKLSRVQLHRHICQMPAAEPAWGVLISPGCSPPPPVSMPIAGCMYSSWLDNWRPPPRPCVLLMYAHAWLAGPSHA